MKLIYIMGKSASGKDTIYKILKEKLNMNTYVMYTTRPMRNEETDGITYNFISDGEMQDYIEGKKEYKVIESRTYQTIYGPWTYTTVDDYQFKSDKDILMLGTLESYMKIKTYFEDSGNVKLLPVYIEVPDNIRLKRAIEREEKQKDPKYLELCRRFIADSEDFSEINIKKAGIIQRFENIDLDKCVQEIVGFIM